MFQPAWFDMHAGGHQLLQAEPFLLQGSRREGRLLITHRLDRSKEQHPDHLKYPLNI